MPTRGLIDVYTAACSLWPCSGRRRGPRVQEGQGMASGWNKDKDTEPNCWRPFLPARQSPAIHQSLPPPPSPPPPGPRSPAGETSPFCRPSPRGQPCVSSGTLSQRHPRWTQQMPDGCSPQEPPWLSQMAQPLRLLPESLTTFPETPSVHDMSASPPEWPAL